jgi:hypothetical protein
VANERASMGEARRRKLAGTYPTRDDGPWPSLPIVKPSLMTDAQLEALLAVVDHQLARPGFMDLMTADLADDDSMPGTPHDKARPATMPTLGPGPHDDASADYDERTIHSQEQAEWEAEWDGEDSEEAAEMIPGAVAFKSVLRVELPNGGIYQCGGMDKPDSC